MQGVESSLGIKLLERTTRNVRVTQAGDFLYHEAARLLGDVEQSLRHLSQEFAGARNPDDFGRNSRNRNSWRRDNDALQVGSQNLPLARVKSVNAIQGLLSRSHDVQQVVNPSAAQALRRERANCVGIVGSR